MLEQNEQTISPPQLNEMCTIRIIFPVESDEQALSVKKRIRETLGDIPNVQVHFAIVPNLSMPLTHPR